MMDDRARFKILFALLAFLLTYFCPNLLSHYTTLNFDQATFYEYFGFSSPTENKLEREIINSWQHLIRLPNRELEENLRVAIGLNTNVDLILSGVELFKQLKIDNESQLSKFHQTLNNLNQFKECFRHFFHKGSAAERSFANYDDFERVINATKSLKKQWFIGGNAALMAQAISKRFSTSEVLLTGPIGPKLKKLLNNKIQIPNDSLIEKDEIHLILEYNSNETFENLRAPSSNRFIVSHDKYNSRIEMLDEFFNITSSFNPHITILSGLHLLESQSEEFRLEKLESFKHFLSSQKLSSNVVHLELASIGDKELMKNILENNLFQEINSLGLNEQELLFLSYSHGNGPHSQYYEELSGQPDLEKIIDILEWTLVSSFSSGQSKLTRIHFHCLMYHIIAELDEGNKNKWSNTISSLLSGSKIAAKQACGFEYDDEANNKQLAELLEFRIAHTHDAENNILFKIGPQEFAKFNSSNPVIQFRRGSVKFYFTPVLVCKKPLKTVGLGDAISSNGILYNHFKHN